jgi:phospholipid/cholesterol/gamma-HCH transport system substrate-binding protein
MPSQSRMRWAELRVGLLAIAALGILGYLIFLLSGQNGFFRSRVEIYTYVGDSSDLAEGAPVRLNGIDIGKVKHVQLSGSTDPRRVVKIVAEVYDEYLRSIPVDSKAQVSQSNLLSPRYLNITKGDAKETIKAGAELPSSSTAELETLFQQGNTTLAALQETVLKIKELADDVMSGKGSIGKLLVDPALFDNANQVVLSVRKLVDALNSNKGTLGLLINDDALAKQFTQTMDRVNQLLEGVEQGKGTLGKVVKDPAMYDNLQAGITDLRKGIDQFNTLLADLNAGKGTAGQLLKSNDLANQIHETIARLDTTLDKINSGEGTIGQLLNNPSLYESLDGTMRETHGLIKDFRANPKKFLSIKLHIF